MTEIHDEGNDSSVPTQEQHAASARWRTAYAALKRKRHRRKNVQRLVGRGGDRVNGSAPVDWLKIHKSFDKLKNTPVDIFS
jgi:hypothetical protein